MSRLTFRDNTKVHYAGVDSLDSAITLYCAGVRYVLWTAYPYVYRKLFSSKGQNKTALNVPLFVQEHFEHDIMDSGIFSLYAKKGEMILDTRFFNSWCDAYIDFVKENGICSTLVEIDAQSFIGNIETEKIRSRLTNSLSNTRFIGVWHTEEGQKGLDRLLDQFDYIAVSSPALRRSKVTDRLVVMRGIIDYVKCKRPETDIHILGCAEVDILRKTKDVTSTDATSWLSARQFGTIFRERVERYESSLFKRFAYVPEKLERYTGRKLSDTTKANIIKTAVSIYIYNKRIESTIGGQR